MIDVSALSRKDLAGLVCETLSNVGIDVVLSGGSCVSVYTENAFASLDLDFIDVSYSPKRRIQAALKSIGFESENNKYFTCPDTELAVEFPSAPLMVGDEHVEEVATLETKVGVLRLLRPTDCIKDRLAAYYYHRDNQCLEQALGVARRHPVDWVSLELWHKNEGQLRRFELFRQAV